MTKTECVMKSSCFANNVSRCQIEPDNDHEGGAVEVQIACTTKDGTEALCEGKIVMPCADDFAMIVAPVDLEKFEIHAYDADDLTSLTSIIACIMIAR